MVSIVCVLLLFILLRVVKKTKLDNTAKLSIASFIVVWLVSVVMVLWNPGGMSHVGDYTFLLIGINVLSFTIGFIAFHSNFSTNEIREINFRKTFDIYINRIIDNKLFLIIIIIALAYTTRLIAINYQTMIISQTLSEVRDSYFEDADALYGNGFSLIRDWFLMPLSKVAIPVFAYTLYKKRNLLCLLLGMFLFEYSSLSGGRFGYVTVVVGIFFVVFCVLYYEDRKSRLVLIGALFSVFLLLMIAVTLFRSGVMEFSRSSAMDNSEGLTSSLAIYLTGPVGALDYAIDNNYVAQVGGHTYGVATFSSIDRFLQPFFKIVDPGHLPLSNRFIGFKQENMIRLFDNFGSYNALYTSILFFYVDFGFFGVILLPLLLGYLFRRLFVMFRKKPSFAMLILLTWMFDVCLHSVFDFYLTSFMHPIMIILLLFWHVNSKISVAKPERINSI